MKILCIDSEEDFVTSLKEEGHVIHSEELGYKSGSAYIYTPPDDMDAMFFNLKKPACFDRLKWGTVNTKYKCRIEPTLTDAVFKRSDEVIPRYQLITYNQINTLQSPFVKNDIINAINGAGCPLFIFLNYAYMKHVYYGFDFFGVTMHYARTDAITFEIDKEFSTLFPSLFKSIKIPIKFKMELIYNVTYPKYIDVISYIGREFFSKLFVFGKGFIWILPECNRNDVVARSILQNLSELKKIIPVKKV